MTVGAEKDFAGFTVPAVQNADDIIPAGTRLHRCHKPPEQWPIVLCGCVPGSCEMARGEEDELPDTAPANTANICDEILAERRPLLERAFEVAGDIITDPLFKTFPGGVIANHVARAIAKAESDGLEMAKRIIQGRASQEMA